MSTSVPALENAAGSCCSPITGGVMDEAAARELSAKFKAMGDPTRLRLLSMVAAADGGEACVCDLNEPLELSQGTVSHHLAILVRAGLLSRTRRGVWSYYALVPGALPALAETLAV